VAHQLRVGDVDADLEIAEETAALLQRLLIEALIESFYLLVIGRNPGAQ
jgi:hypothetical protein